MMDGLVKVVADANSGETLGIHMIGPMATELLAEASLGMTLEATPRELGWTVAAHPTLGEAVKEAALAVDGRSDPLLDGVIWRRTTEQRRRLGPNGASSDGDRPTIAWRCCGR